MAVSLDMIRDIPGYKTIVKALLRNQIQNLVEQLSAEAGEESIILTASVSDGTLCHLGSVSGKTFLDDNEDFKSQFLGYCLKRHQNQADQLHSILKTSSKRQIGRPRASSKISLKPLKNATQRAQQGPAQSTTTTSSTTSSPHVSGRHRMEPYPVGLPSLIRQNRDSNQTGDSSQTGESSQTGDHEFDNSYTTVKVEPIDPDFPYTEGNMTQTEVGDAYNDANDDKVSYDLLGLEVDKLEDRDSSELNSVSMAAKMGQFEDDGASGMAHVLNLPSTSSETATSVGMETMPFKIELNDPPGDHVDDPEKWKPDLSYSNLSGAAGSSSDMPTVSEQDSSKYEPEIDEQKVKARKEKKRISVQGWRKKLSENKVKYEELKQADRERRKNARLRKKQQSLLDPHLHQELKKKKREEMKRYRQKKKEKTAVALKDHKGIDLKGPTKEEEERSCKKKPSMENKYQAK